MPRRVPSIALLLFALGSGTAWAAANPFGLNAAWNDCWGDGGESNRMFACNTNAGMEQLNLSFKLDQVLANVVGMEMYLQLASETPVLPEWWSLKAAGTCRPTSLGFSVLPDPAWTQCQDWSDAFAVGGIGNYVMGAAGPNSASTAAAAAVPSNSGIVLAPGVEYWSGAILIHHAKTVGSGACSGCVTPVCILYSKFRILTEFPSESRWITTPANTPNSAAVTWQNGMFFGLSHLCDPLGNCTTSFGCGSQPVSSRSGSWGSIKALYH